MVLPAWVNLLLIAVICFLAAPLLLGPLLLRWQHHIRRDFRIDPVSAEDVPPAAAMLAEGERAAFEEHNFTWLGYYRFADYAPGTQAWFSLYRHAHDEGPAAMTAAIYQVTGASEPAFMMGYAEISGLFDGDFSLCVNNSPQLGAFDSEKKLVLRYPGEPVPELLRRFRKVKGLHPKCHRYVHLPPGQEIGRIRSQLLKEIEEQAAEGLYIFDPPQNRYRLSWTGAIVMTMRHLPPFALLRNAADLRKAAAWARKARF